MYVILVFLALTTTSLQWRGASAASTPNQCVADPVSPKILRNDSLTYLQKMNLFNANELSYNAWSLNVTRLTNGNTSYVELPQVPAMCPSIRVSPTTFTPNATSFLFSFQYSDVRHVVNVTSAGVRCGVDCASDEEGNSAASYAANIVGEPIAVRDVVSETNVNATETLSNCTNVTIEVPQPLLSNSTANIWCAVTDVPPSVPFDAVCTAYIQYNETYWENSSVYAMPATGVGVAPVILDPMTTTLRYGISSPIVLWLPPEVNVCPWYYNISTMSAPPPPPRSMNNSSASGDSSSLATIQVPSLLVFMSYTTKKSPNTLKLIQALIPLMGVTCDVTTAPHPLSSNNNRSEGGVNSTSARITGHVESAQLIAFDSAFDTVDVDAVLSYNLFLIEVRIEYFLSTLPVTDARGFEAAAGSGNFYPFASMTFKGKMVPSLSPWWPMENYSSPDFSSIPRRCYASSPISIMNVSTTLFVPSLTCSSGEIASLPVDVLNATSFCCYMNVSLNEPFVWPGDISVYDSGDLWFTDAAGIVTTPPPRPTTTTRAPPAQAPNNTATTAGSTGDEGGGDSGISRGGDSDDASSSSTALILGVSMVAIGATVVLMVVLYFKWWKPRQGSGGGVTNSHKHKIAALGSPLLLLDVGDDDQCDGSLERDLPRSKENAKLERDVAELFFDEVGSTEM